MKSFTDIRIPCVQYESMHTTLNMFKSKVFLLSCVTFDEIFPKSTEPMPYCR